MVTDEELIERRKIFNGTNGTDKFAVDNPRYSTIRNKCGTHDLRNYMLIKLLVDLQVPDDEILSMNFEERVTYLHLFGSQEFTQER